MQSSTWMDVVSRMLSSEKFGTTTTRKPSMGSSAPRDSLSPLDGQFRGKGDVNTMPREQDPMYSNQDEEQLPPPVSQDTVWETVGRFYLGPDASAHDAQTEQQIACPPSSPAHATATLPDAVSTTPEACSPRSALLSRANKPTDLRLTKSNGLSTLASPQLKQAICDGHTDPNIPPRKSSKCPQDPFADAAAMGNNHSSLGEIEDATDNASVSSLARRPMRVLRKSSTNLFKRIDSKSPLPRPLTATSIVVHQHSTHASDESGMNPFTDPPHSARDSIIMLPSASTMTVTGMSGMSDTTEQPLSASTTIKAARSDSKSPLDRSEEDTESEGDHLPPPAIDRATALSPTIPAPSPLPEDSPHKYGLKDRMDTPEPPPAKPTEDLKVAKNRRSSAFELFNVSLAKSAHTAHVKQPLTNANRKSNHFNPRPHSSTASPPLAAERNHRTASPTTHGHPLQTPTGHHDPNQPGPCHDPPLLALHQQATFGHPHQEAMTAAAVAIFSKPTASHTAVHCHTTS
jgi:hypothetical protein